MTSINAIIQSISKTELTNIFRLIAENKTEKIKIELELPKKLLIFKEKDKITVDISHSEPKSVKTTKHTIVLDGRIYETEKEDSNKKLFLSFWGLKSEIIMPSQKAPRTTKKEIYLIITKK